MVECPQCGHALMNARNRYLYPLIWLWHKLPTSELRSCWLWSWRSWGGTQSSLWWPARLSTSASRILKRWNTGLWLDQAGYVTRMLASDSLTLRKYIIIVCSLGWSGSLQFHHVPGVHLHWPGQDGQEWVHGVQEVQGLPQAPRETWGQVSQTNDQINTITQKSPNS